MSSRSQLSERSTALDVLRAAAVVLVLGRHMPEFSRAEVSFVGPLLDAWRRGGWIGVDLFFVLSGFLISGLLFREYLNFGEIKYGTFLLRRAFKIYPAFYFMLAVTLVVAACSGSIVPWRSVLCEALFVQNYGPALFPHSWSLAVEEHFYLLLPLLLIFLYRRGGKDGMPFAALPWVCLAVAVLELGGRAVTALLWDFSLKRNLFPTHLRADSLLFGVTLSYFHYFHRARLDDFVSRFRVPLGVCAALFLMPPFFIELGRGMFLHTVGLTFIALGSGIVLLLMLRHFDDGSQVRVIAFIGTRSYSIYLWHIIVRFWIVPRIGGVMPVPAEIAIYFATCILLGIVAAKLVEMPALAIRDRVCRSRSQLRV